MSWGKGKIRVMFPQTIIHAHRKNENAAKYRCKENYKRVVINRNRKILKCRELSPFKFNRTIIAI